MKTKGMLTGLAALCIFLLVTTLSTAWAWEGLRYGNLRITPRLDLRYMYDDNIYLGNGTNATTEKKESDAITFFQPGLVLDYDMGARGSAKAGYVGNFAAYRDNDKNDWKDQSGFFNVDYTAPGGLIAGLNEVYRRSEDPYADAEEYNLGQITKRWTNDLNGKLGYQWFDEYRVIGYGRYWKQDYDLERDFTQNYDLSDIGIGVEMRIAPKTWGFCRYFYRDQDYVKQPAGVNDTNDADSTSHVVQAGLGWDPGAKLRGELNLGYEWRNYKNDVDVYGDRYEDRNSWIASTSVEWQATAKTRLTGDLSRALRTKFSDSNLYFTDTLFALALDQQLVEALSLRARGAYSQHDYNSPREDDNYWFDLSLRYSFYRWFYAEGAYNFLKKDSTEDEWDYQDNRYSIMVGGTF